jgi:hypothetical protein
MKQNNLFELLDYIKKKNGNNELRSIYGNMDKTLSITNFQTTYYMRSYHQTRKQRSHFEIILNESLDGNLNIAIYHLAEHKVERTIDFYKGKITESTINKIENELRDFFFILLLDKDIVEKIISKSKIGKRTTTLPIIQVSVNIGNKKLNSFIINWLNEVFDSNREDMDNHIDSFDIFKNENLIETYITKPKDLVNLIKKNPEWREYLELTYAV